MRCPHCASSALVERTTKQGVLVDLCEQCHGIWLDRGEIYLLSRHPRRLEKALGARADRRPSQRCCPRCGTAMEAGGFLDSRLQVETCPKCDGMWFDQGELREALSLEQRLFQVEIDPLRPAEPAAGEVPEEAERDPKARQRLAAVAAGMLPLPNLAVRSAGVLLFLYAMLSAVLLALVEFSYLAPTAALAIGIVVIVAQYVLSPWLMDLCLRWFYQFEWVSADGLPDHLRRFVEGVCKKHGLRFPKFGLIRDSAPNAFTYGHTPNNMRIVVTQGVLELLEPGEVEAVVAHEIGHGKHWDMALMTLAQIVPLLLYTVYRTLISVRSSGNDRSAGPRILIAAAAYVLYIVSEYAVLWFSRCREYHADRFAGEATGDPAALASALVKIGYGLAAAGKPEKKQEREEAGRHSSRLDSISAMGIYDAGQARCLVMAATGTGPAGEVSRESLKSAMQWDLWNPWAKFYELHSTHPLIAHRLSYLADQSAAAGKEPYVVFDRRKPESYWDDFFVDLGVMFLPLLLPAAAALAWTAAGLPWNRAGLLGGLLLAAFGLGALLKTWCEYRGGFFAPLSVAALLHKVKVSRVRPVPVRVQGTIIGRGVPGLVWSEDLVLRDDTGLLFLDYRQPLRIWEWLFGLFRAGRFIGKKVTVTGWFRRAPVPYLEVKNLESEEGGFHSYARHARWAVGILLLVAGVVLMVM